MCQFGAPKLALYDAATWSEANPDPLATVPGLFNPSGLYARGNLLFVIDVGVIYVVNLEDLMVLGEINFDEESEPVELIYSSSEVLYVRLPDAVEVWSDLLVDPMLTQVLLAEGEALGMALQECLSDAGCAEGSCVSGVCRP